MPDFAHFFPLVEVYQIDGKLHEERVDRLARADPQPFTRFQPLMLEQSRAPLSAGIRHIRGGGQHRVAGLIANADFQIGRVAR